jgi:hypothetical protein
VASSTFFAPSFCVTDHLRGLLLREERFEVGHGALHHAGALHHLRQEHLAAAEEIAHHVHAGHQRAFDHEHGVHVFHAGLFRVLLDVVGDAMHERMLQALFHTAFAPGGLRGYNFCARCALELLRERDHTFCCIGATCQQHILHVFQQVLGDVVVHAHLTGVDDAHVETGFDGVVEEGGVDGLAHGFVAAEAEAHVAHAAAGQCTGQVLLDPAHGLR